MCCIGQKLESTAVPEAWQWRRDSAVLAENLADRSPKAVSWGAVGQIHAAPLTYFGAALFLSGQRHSLEPSLWFAFVLLLVARRVETRLWSISELPSPPALPSHLVLLSSFFTLLPSLSLALFARPFRLSICGKNNLSNVDTEVLPGYSRICHQAPLTRSFLFLVVSFPTTSLPFFFSYSKGKVDKDQEEDKIRLQKEVVKQTKEAHVFSPQLSSNV